MTSALVNVASGPQSPELSDDLEAVGIHVVGAASNRELVQEVVRATPDLVVCFDSRPGDGLFQATEHLRATAPLPVVVFTTDPDADKIDRAARSGIDAYVINGYGQHRLRSVIHLAQARFRYDQLLREELSDITQRFEERKLVDRAKGILMRARQLSEDDAFRLLRTAAMQVNTRIGQVAQQVIDAARYAEAVNRAGQLRMLSQRIVKLQALRVAGVNAASAQDLLSDSVERTERNIAILRRSLSSATFGDMVESVNSLWLALAAAVQAPPARERLAETDSLAESLLLQAERLTGTLESAGMAGTLHVINVAGRQRMLSQRVAKEALLATLRGMQPDAATGEAFDKALGYLEQLPLSSVPIREQLALARDEWTLLRKGLQTAHTAAGQAAIAHSSEALLECFEMLTEHYERSMQMLMG